MYIKGVSESRVIYLTGKEFLALEELVNKRLDEWKHSTSPKESPPDPDNIREQLFTNLCDRIKELESWREGVDLGQLHSQFPITNIIALQNRVDSIKDHITDLSATVTQHKAEQDNLDKLGSPHHNKAYVSTLKNRLSTIENRLITLSRAVGFDKKDKHSRLENIEERITYRVERITTLEHNT